MSELPPGWALATADQITACERNALTIGPFGSNLKVRDYRSSGVPLVFVRNIRACSFEPADLRFVSPEKAESLRAHQVRHGDLLITKMGDPPGDAAIYPLAEPGIITADCIKLTPHPLIDVRYLLYAISTPEVQRQISNITQGVAQRKVSLDRFRKGISIPLAPRAEQKRIVAAVEEQFSRLDTGAAALERVQKNLKRVRTAVLQIAVTGRLVPQDPSEGQAADLLATIKLASRSRSRRSEDLTTLLPSLPRSWSTAPWSTIAYSQNGRSFPSAEYTTVGARLLRPGNLYASGEVGWTAANTRYMPESYANDFPGHLVGANEIVMNLTAQSLKDEFLGRVCMTGPREEPVLLNQRLARLTPVGMNPRFIFYVLKSPIFRRFVDQLNTGSVIQHMFTSQLDQFVLPIPPLGEQDRIVQRLEEILTLFNYLEVAISKIGKQVPALRSAILDAAFSGRLVPQDPSDEPASELLDRIRIERASSNGQKLARTRRPRPAQEKVTA